MKISEITAKEAEISEMDSDKLEAFARVLSASPLKGKPRRLLLEAIDSRKDELKDNVSILTVDSVVKMDGESVEI